ncbi:hypothetical protein HDU76_006118, partial [Blyttiomyces sp. JEL0837]
DAEVFNKAVIRTARRGQLEVVRFLMTIPGVDPTTDDNEAVKLAAFEGYEEVVKFLLTFPGVELPSLELVIYSEEFWRNRSRAVPIWLHYSDLAPATIVGHHISSSITLGDLDIVKMYAAWRGRKGIVDYFINLAGVDKAAVVNSALSGAASSGQIDIVQFLLGLPEVDPSVDNSLALRMAAMTGRLEIAKMLLEFPGVDVTAENNEAFVVAAEQGYLEVLELLLENVRVSNEFVEMVGKVGAKGFVNMFEGPYTFRTPETEKLARRERALIKLRTAHGGFFINIIQFILTKINIEADSSIHIQPHTEPRLTLSKQIVTKAIYTAFDYGDLDIIKLLLQLPNDDPTLKEHDSFMSGAVKHVHVLRFLLSDISSINVKDTAVSALIFASEGGHVETVQVLLSSFPELFTLSETDSNDNEVRSALFKAAMKAGVNGQFDIAKLLLVSRGKQ